MTPPRLRVISVERSRLKTKTRAPRGQKSAFQVEIREWRPISRYAQTTAATVKMAGMRGGVKKRPAPGATQKPRSQKQPSSANPMEKRQAAKRVFVLNPTRPSPP